MTNGFIGRKKFGALIKQGRKDKGMTQSRLARLCGLSRRTICNAESGVTIRVPRPESLFIIASCLGLSVSRLLESFDYREPKESAIKIARYGRFFHYILCRLKIRRRNR